MEKDKIEPKVTDITPLKEPTKKPTKAVVVKGRGSLTVGTANEAAVRNRIEALNGVAKAIKETLIDGADYGIIPSTKKPSLFKSGAEKITMLYGLRAKFTKVYREDMQDGWLEYEFNCELIDSKGNFVSQGMGVCSSRETKYSSQDPWNLRNTIMKMSKKRALVDAVLMIGNLSEVFTQDMEDLPLSTANAAKTLSKDEKLELYQLAYTHWDEMISGAKNKTTGKGLVKTHLKEVFTKIGITKSNFMQFDVADSETFRKYINEGGK